MSGSAQVGNPNQYLVYLTEQEINYLRRLVQSAVCTGAHAHDLLHFEGRPTPRAEVARIMELEEKLKDAWLRTGVERTTRPYTVPGDLETALARTTSDGEK